MFKRISVIGGGGTVGSTTAFCLGKMQICEEIILYDVATNLARHHTYDIGSAICKSSSTRIVAAESAADIANSDIVIIAASFPTGEGGVFKCSDELVSAITNVGGILKDYAPGSVIFTLSNPVDVLNTMLWKFSGKPAKEFFGFSLNDSIRLDMAVAEFVGCEPKNVKSYCVGEHGFSKVPVLSSISINGKNHSFSDEDAEKIQKIAADRWLDFLRLGINRTAGWSTGAYVVTCVEALAGINEEPLECSVILDGEYGYSGLSLGTPVYLCADGVKKIVELELNDREKKLLRKSYELVQAKIDDITNYAGEVGIL